MAKKDKSAKAPTPDEVEAIFSDVDETGHTNASKARKERTRRRARKAAVEVDPLSGDDPSGSNVGKTMTRAAVVVLIVLLVAVVVSQVACGLVRRAGTAQLAEHVDAASVNTALRNGVEWGDGFTQFPEDYTVLEANEKSGTIEVSVVDTSSKNELECLRDLRSRLRPSRSTPCSTPTSTRSSTTLTSMLTKTATSSSPRCLASSSPRAR